MSRPLRTAAIAGSALAALYALPALASIGPLRNRLAPRLAGVGHPDHVALTFDDGPHPLSTPRFLAELERLDVRATFFLLGRWAARSPILAKEIVAAGHEVAVHGYEHRCLLARGAGATYDDLARARDVIADATGEQPRWFRPPYGVLTGAVLTSARRLGLSPVLWTAWGEDWTARATPDSVYRTVVADLAGGGTILLHDSDVTSVPGSWRATLGAVPRLVDTCRARGLRVGPLAEHGVDGGTVASGTLTSEAFASGAFAPGAGLGTARLVRR
ncbi:polysaccharide deacetylase family protein [Rugosimonospora africana]|uniref:Polysaccharide deacetylase familiy protein n=1 Tax=Rugosimonospora africana TaxID=556532 RepID=A0A8J3QU21_9ACTN|nr:polysaccharide deacetylase family protein [Rugosimonospora africana]GIH16544.1 polysaccharide deacetylase familiy protein [Rugosimonospora africana]